MAKVTPKENFMMLVDGGTPAYIPYFTMMGEPYLGEAATKFVNPNIFGPPTSRTAVMTCGA